MAASTEPPLDAWALEASIHALVATLQKGATPELVASLVGLLKEARQPALPEIELRLRALEHQVKTITDTLTILNSSKRMPAIKAPPSVEQVMQQVAAAGRAPARPAPPMRALPPPPTR